MGKMWKAVSFTAKCIATAGVVMIDFIKHIEIRIRK